MTFRSLFGLSYLLSSYGIGNEAVRVADKSELVKIQPPHHRAGVAFVRIYIFVAVFAYFFVTRHICQEDGSCALFRGAYTGGNEPYTFLRYSTKSLRRVCHTKGATR